MDQEFDKVEGMIGNAAANTTGAREHVAEVERSICTKKYWCRATLSLLLPSIVPKTGYCAPSLLHSAVPKFQAVKTGNIHVDVTKGNSPEE